MIIELSKNIWRQTQRDMENEDKAVFPAAVRTNVIGLARQMNNTSGEWRAGAPL